ncbi:YraN family protein [Kaistella montana]|uniref:UPF0102 protein ACFSO8_08495 n=1 Tax=Kaistella montana TaxID=1849733 RepID=A0ABW5KA40_9FLAO|nr:YraN family protein [Kaistella montana]MCQ4035819.1 YraN family protein [Kaistella montana]
MADHNDFGKLAEDLAAEFLVKKGYKILARNFHFQKLEIDIVAEFHEMIIVAEVKARSYTTVIEPQEAVTKGKIKSIVSCADFFMRERNIDKEVRFDIITIVPDSDGVMQITHIEDAFQSFDAQ